MRPPEQRPSTYLFRPDRPASGVFPSSRRGLTRTSCSISDAGRPSRNAVVPSATLYKVIRASNSLEARGRRLFAATSQQRSLPIDGHSCFDVIGRHTQRDLASTTRQRRISRSRTKLANRQSDTVSHRSPPREQKASARRVKQIFSRMRVSSTDHWS